MANLEHETSESQELVVAPLSLGRFVVKRGEYLVNHSGEKERLSVDLPKFILLPTSNGRYKVIGIMHPAGEFCAEIITPAERNIATEWGLHF